MKRTLLYMSLLALSLGLFVSCSEKDEGAESVTISFEGAAWSALQDKSQQDSYSSNVSGSSYRWQDEATTLGCEALIADGYILSGTLLSSYNSSDITTYGDYTKDLYVYNGSSASTTQGGGHAGSDNFLVAVGNYVDGSPKDERVELRFMDGKARTIAGCYINSTTYFLNIVKNGNAFSPALGEDDVVELEAVGYTATGAATQPLRMELARKGRCVEQWTAWDLSPFGEVVSLRLNVVGGPSTEWGMTTPKYFAIDDITVEMN